MIWLDLQDTGVFRELEFLQGKIELFPIDQVGDIIKKNVQQTIWDIPLYKTGLLYNSVSWEYNGASEVIVDDSAPYSDYLDQGTKYIDAYHFLEITPECDAEIDDFLDKFWGKESETRFLHI